MATLEKTHFDSPDETRKFRAHGALDVISFGDFTIGKGTFEPGWKWSEDVRPIAGTGSCQVRHTGVCISGQMTVRADDGTEMTIGPGDAFLMEPGHDAWVVGEEPCILYDTGMSTYAKPAG
ncbi:MAG: cupin domain-containing protein [Oryzihumus sp.]